MIYTAVILFYRRDCMLTNKVDWDGGRPAIAMGKRSPNDKQLAGH